MSRIPRDFHFVFGLRPQAEPFHLIYYLCLASCIGINRPQNLFFHYHKEPFGPWWEKIKPQLTLRKIEPDPFVGHTRAYLNHKEGRYITENNLQYAHHADFLRLELLLDHGGVYADIDTLFVNPIPDNYYDQSFVMAEEGFAGSTGDGKPVNTLCNALIMARPDANFGQHWYESMYAVFDGSWNRHSCLEAGVLARQYPGLLTVVPQTGFFFYPPTPRGIEQLFASSTADPPCLSEVYSIHLWNHLWFDEQRTDFSSFHGGLLTEAYVRSKRSVYARLAHSFL